MSAGPEGYKPHGHAGFSLIEVIVAMALMSLVVVLLTEAMSRARVALGAVRHGVVAGDVLSAQDFLRTALSQTAPATDVVVGKPPDLVGTASRMVFRTAYAPQSQIEGIYRVELHLQRSHAGPGAYDLLADYVLARPPAAGDAPPVLRSVVLAGIRGAAFAFLDRGPGGNEPAAWQSSWSAADRLPSAVRVDVGFAAGDKRSWPRIEVPLLFAAVPPAACAGSAC